VFEWSDDDEISVAAPSSTEEPPCNRSAEEQSKGGKEVPEQRAMGVRVPKQQARGVLERQVERVSEWQTKRVLEQQAERRPMVEKVGPPPQSTGVDPTAVPGGSSRQRRFKKLHRQIKP